MMKSTDEWESYLRALSEMLLDISCTTPGGEELGAAAGFRQWTDMCLQVRRTGRTVFLIGNGASASMASHLAADLAKNARLRTEVFTDLSLITAISNDLGFERVFSEPLSARGARGDMLVAISSSGRSPNILAGVKQATDMGVSIVTLSAMSAENPLRRMGTLNFHVPAQAYGFAESCHAVILHHWMDRVAGAVGTR